MYRILFFIFFSFCFSHSAKSQPNYQLVATLHPGDCASCLNMLGRFTELIPQVEKSIVFEQKLQADSALLVRDYFLEDFKGSILFSDSLFQRFNYKSGMVSSSISLLNKTNNEFISIPITALADTTIDFRHYLEERDTIEINEMASISYPKIFFTKDKYYCIDQAKMKVFAFNRLNNSLAYDFLVDDAIIKNGYTAKFGKAALDNYSKAENYIKANKFIGGRTSLRSCQVYGDSVLLLLAQPELIYNKYPHPDEGDSVISDFLTLVTVYKGKTIAVQNIENYTTDTYIDMPGIRRNNKDRYDAFWIHDNFFFLSDKLYMKLTAGYVEMVGKNWALAEFILDKNKQWVYSKMAIELPNFYTDTSTLVGYNFIFEGFSIGQRGEYCVFSLGNKLESVVDSSRDIPLSFLPLRLKGGEVFNKDFIVQNDRLFLSTLESIWGRTRVIYYKYNVNTKVLDKKDSFADKSLAVNGYIKIDPFEPNYVYNILDNKRIVRLKVFSD